jgi:hypothetical protein
MKGPNERGREDSGNAISDHLQRLKIFPLGAKTPALTKFRKLPTSPFVYTNRHSTLRSVPTVIGASNKIMLTFSHSSIFIMYFTKLS